MNSPKKPPQSRVVDKPASNAWQGNATRPKAAAAARARTAARAKKAEPWEVTPESLACLDAVRSLLTALKRLERSGWLDAEWRATENARRAKYYTLTRAGRKQLEVETADWSRRVSAIARLLEAGS